MGKILSYYLEENDKTVEENLIDHINIALDFTKGLKTSKVARFADKLCREVDFQDLIRLSIIFHDAGKVFYQRNFITKEERKFLSFRGHEYLSAYIFEEFRNKLIEQNLENCEKYGLYKACTFAIFYHHHAMNVRLRTPQIIEESIKNGLNLLNSFKNDVQCLFTRDELNALEDAVDVIKSLPIESFLANIRREVDETNRELWNDLIAKPEIKKLSFLTLSILLAADYSAAQKKRKSGQSMFKRALDDFYYLYLTHV
ncbi:CRISPR-associated endonuclease Cas3'' [Archaeoglobales archaeon]|nr:MAG: CRISPR-associated endonuclease Cas3'' [Archaeoglobales archaeon]